jgi:hypothetical protein
MRQNNPNDPVTGGGPSMSVPVGPVVPGRRLPTLPLVVAVIVVVGAIAFLAGLQSGGRSGTTTIPVASPSASPTAFATERPTATPVAVVPGQSEFARTFQPLGLIARIAGGFTCVGDPLGQLGQPGSGLATPTFVSAWMTFCPLPAAPRNSLPAARRDAFVKNLVDELGRVTPTHGYSVMSDEQGRFLAVFPYDQTSFVGSVTMAAVVRGAGIEISITLEERVGP